MNVAEDDAPAEPATPAAPTVTGIRLDKEADTTKYNIISAARADLDLSGMKLYLKYSDGSESLVPDTVEAPYSNYVEKLEESEEFQALKGDETSYDVGVNYQGYETTFTIQLETVYDMLRNENVQEFCFYTFGTEITIEEKDYLKYFVSANHYYLSPSSIKNNFGQEVLESFNSVDMYSICQKSSRYYLVLRIR